jgi:hypothetical protein
MMIERSLDWEALFSSILKASGGSLQIWQGWQKSKSKKGDCVFTRFRGILYPYQKHDKAHCCLATNGKGTMNER